ncbi:TPA: hypothetical protein ACX6MG_002981 [Photobacterium damselae]
MPFKSLLFIWALLLSEQIYAEQHFSWVNWPVVGKTELTWGWWTIYQAQLRTPSGQYQAEREIDASDLLQATDEQWQHLGYSQQQRQVWLKFLQGIWPNVRQGDRLIFVVQDEIGYFLFQNKVIGTISNPSLNRAFLAIWLSPNSSYPKLRLELIGRE